MTLPPDAMDDMRSTDADGVPRAEMARRLRVGRNTVAKYAGMEDLSPSAPVPAPRERPALAGHEAWAGSVLEADLAAPRKRRHTARRVFDRLVSERGHGGPTRRRGASWVTDGSPARPAPAGAVSSSSGRRGPAGPTSATSGPSSPGRPSTPSPSSRRCPTPTTGGAPP